MGCVAGKAATAWEWGEVASGCGWWWYVVVVAMLLGVLMGVEWSVHDEGSVGDGASILL